jgi:hypothetical protein
MRAQKPIPPELAARPFTVAEALERGVSHSRLRSRDLEAPFHGIRSVPVDRRSADRGYVDQGQVLAFCLAYLPKMGTGSYFSHLTAAMLYGFPLRRMDAMPLHVSSPAGPPRSRGIVGHRGDASPRLYRGVSVVDPVAAWLQLAPLVDFDDLVIAGDFLVRRKRPLATLEALAATVATPGVRHIRALRRALAEVRRGTDSAMETRLRLLIVRAGLPEPVIGHTITDGAGGFIGTPDLCYVEARIAIEYEGAHHQSDPAVFAEDIERRELMQEAGWYVIRVISDHVFRHPKWLVTRIGRVLAERS